MYDQRRDLHVGACRLGLRQRDALDFRLQARIECRADIAARPAGEGLGCAMPRTVRKIAAAARHARGGHIRHIIGGEDAIHGELFRHPVAGFCGLFGAPIRPTRLG